MYVCNIWDEDYNVEQRNGGYWIVFICFSEEANATDAEPVTAPENIVLSRAYQSIFEEVQEGNSSFFSEETKQFLFFLEGFNAAEELLDTEEQWM